MRRFQLFALAAVVACASSGSSNTTEAKPAQDRNVITETELMSVPSSSLYDAVEKLRPNFLRSRGASSFSNQTAEFASVYVDEHPYGEIGSLRTLVTGQIGMVRYYDAMAAQQKFGLTSGNGVISVYIKR
jgi:hypothetical protein